MDRIIEYGKNFFDVRFTGEAILVVGCFFKDILNHVQGAISIGPFACMPTRVIEAVLSAESTMENKRYSTERTVFGERPAGTNRQFAVSFNRVRRKPVPQIIERE